MVGLRADDGCAARRALLLGSRRERALLTGDRLNLCKPRSIRPQRGPYRNIRATLDADREALEKLGVDFFLRRRAEEMYPKGFSDVCNRRGLSERLEGKSPPGSFSRCGDGGAEAAGDRAAALTFFGRKDAQQERVIRQMAQDLNLDAAIVACPIVREAGWPGAFLPQRLSRTEDRAAAARLIAGARSRARERIFAGERNRW